MNSLRQLEQALATRRTKRQGSPNPKALERERLDINEVHNTNLEVGLFSGEATRPDASEHYKDITYTKSWYLIYQALKDQKLIPERVMLLNLKKAGENRVEELEEKLDAILKFEYDEDKPTRDIYQPKIDLIRWKIKYYQRTLLDARYLLDMHDSQTMFSELPMGSEGWWTAVEKS
ncbi:hypothetical protein TWF481_002095 [Arthrobotrys musiformis]|uniref:Uncharacterized protein n=1 Tax=Arthrobotrys musiformis TaxID=47236 RepID=A0AAV9VUM8_9PEZI